MANAPTIFIQFQANFTESGVRIVYSLFSQVALEIF